MVYNIPDIDTQKVVWAFGCAAEADRPLPDYYRGRKIWLVPPDGLGPTMESYAIVPESELINVRFKLNIRSCLALSGCMAEGPLPSLWPAPLAIAPPTSRDNPNG